MGCSPAVAQQACEGVGKVDTVVLERVIGARLSQTQGGSQARVLQAHDRLALHINQHACMHAYTRH